MLRVRKAPKVSKLFVIALIRHYGYDLDLIHNGARNREKLAGKYRNCSDPKILVLILSPKISLPTSEWNFIAAFMLMLSFEIRIELNLPSFAQVFIENIDLPGDLP